MRKISCVLVLLVAASWLLWAALPATDAFTNTDGTNLEDHNAGWVDNGCGAGDGAATMKINTNAVYPACSSGSTYVAYHWHSDTFNANQYSEAVYGTTGEGGYVGVVVRAATNGDATYYVYYCDNSVSKLDKVVSGTATNLGVNWDAVCSAGTVIRLEVNGTTLTAKLDGAADSFSPVTDSDISSGAAGVGGLGSATWQRLTSWESGDLSASGTARRRVIITQ